MIDDLDILRAANILIKRHGADATLVAAHRADELLKAGDTDGCAIWKRILSAVAEPTRTTPAEGERVTDRVRGAHLPNQATNAGWYSRATGSPL
jgi:hypothetical protein